MPRNSPLTTQREPSLTVATGNATDACPLCGIHRENAGFLKETCGDGYLKPGCFIVPKEQTS